MGNEKIFIALLCQASSSIGLGHLSRLLAISEALPGNYVACLHGEIEDSKIIEGMLIESGVGLTCSCSLQPKIVFVDSYDENILKRFTFKSNPFVVGIVDNSSPIIDADYFVEASPTLHWGGVTLNAPILKFEISPLLRSNFFNCEELVSTLREEPSGYNVLIVLGSCEKWEQVLNLIVEVAKNNLRIERLSIFTNNPKVMGFASSRGIKSVDPNRGLAQTVKDFDFVLSAAGVTAWELISLKMNCILMALVENQLYQLQYLIQKNLAAGVDLTKIDENAFINLASAFDAKVISLEKKVPTLPSAITNGAVRLIAELKRIDVIN
jgi:spore coat polysaccharide biosynthesis predicted glycosyltransferase SpsG